jgi:1-acyl-sn-glycerol-3-phosphate acyltransferase
MLYVAVSLIVFFPIFKFLLSKSERFPTAFKVIRFYGKSWLFFTGVYVKVKGKENIIKGQPFIITSNHSSFLDPTCLYSIYDEYFVFTGKKEIEKWPLFHIFYTSGMNILVDRHSRVGAMRSFKRMMDVIDSGTPIVILPEGTISKDAPKLAEFKTGAVTIAIQKQVPIQPITFTTNWKRLERKGWFTGKASPGIVEAVIHPAISTKGLTKADAEDLNNKLREVINKPLNDIYGV